MKILFCITIIFFACSNNEQKNHDHENFSGKATIIDSVKWSFYAYTYQSKVLFKNADKNITLNALECDVVITKSEHDSSVYLAKYKKDGFEYNHIYEGLMIYGFKYEQGVFTPLTGMVKLDEFDKLEYGKNDNFTTSQNFQKFMQENKAAQNNISNWLKTEAKQKGFY